MINEEIEAIIFDLGGVILNIDYSLTAEAFKQLGLQNFDEVYSQLCQTDLFDRFETGHVSTFHFINRILDQLPRGRNGNQVVHAWDAMILDFPKVRLEFIAGLKKKYRVFLLSNTNDIHMDRVRRALEMSVGHRRLEDYFECMYLSCEMGMRKPDPEIFLRVCNDQKLDPAKTLFIDDSPQHIEGAKAAGLQTVYLAKGTEVQSLFF